MNSKHPPSAAPGDYQGKRICVTGGTGSIGLELVRALLHRNPKEVRIFSNDENGLFEATTLLGQPKVEYRLGDVRDIRSVERAIVGCDIVFHAAALKHVDFCESNPSEAILTNIIGTQNVIEAGLRYNVKRFVFISTDKAVNPVNTMGATKLIGEKLVADAAKLANRESPTFSTVRFGNVIGTRGSVVAIFKRSVKEGKPITVTEPSMTRFIMAPSDASRLILHASEVAKQGELFVLKMKAVRIGDLAEACKTFFSKLFARDASAIPTVLIGPGPGEKMHEQLMTEDERARALDFGEYVIINPHKDRKGKPQESPKGRSDWPIASDSSPLASHAEINRILSKLEE